MGPEIRNNLVPMVWKSVEFCGNSSMFYAWYQWYHSGDRWHHLDSRVNSAHPMNLLGKI